MKRFLVALMAGSAVFTIAFAAAAALSVDGGAIQAGSDETLTCASEADVLGWGLETDDGNVNNVRIQLHNYHCDGNTLFVAITDHGNVVADGNVEMAGGVTTYTIPFTVPGSSNTTPNEYAAANITDIEVFIEGPNGN